MALTVTWIGHASFVLNGNITVYIDPWKIEGEPHDGDVVLVSHSHYDHYSPEDVAAVSKDGTLFLASKDVVDEAGYGEVLMPGESRTLVECGVKTVHSYNPDKPYHPKEENWLGFIIELDGKRIYYAGDTDVIDEMEQIGEVDLALLPVGGTYTMNAAEAAEAVKRFAPKQIVPYHWGDIVGSRKDAEKLVKQFPNQAVVVRPGDSIEL